MFDLATSSITGTFIFVGAIVAMLVVDLLLFRGSETAPSLRKAAVWSALWGAVSVAFGLGVWLQLGPKAGSEFFTAYVLEKTLSVDNVFVFVMIFAAFAVPSAHQQRVLFWGVLGAIIMRAGFIALGTAVLAKAHFVIYIFGAILVATALKLAFSKGDMSADASDSAPVRILKRLIPVTSASGTAFFVKGATGKWSATPLFLALLAVAFTDVVFAVDSIPAVFAVTRDPFIVLTSNVFAVLGLRALYFLLAGSVRRFVYLRYGLAVVLGFVGLKMCFAQILTVPPFISLLVVSTVLTMTIVLSLWRTRATQVVSSCN
jgi:tellurite resistance protein TerC